MVALKILIAALCDDISVFQQDDFITILQSAATMGRNHQGFFGRKNMGNNFLFGGVIQG